jgi:hypothetical protein
VQPAAHQAHVATRECSGCGALVELHGANVSTDCNYCGAPLVDSSRAAASVRRVAPFRVTEPVAKNKLHDFLRGQFWAPKEVKTLNFGGRGLRGVLVPHYAYKGVVRSSYQAKVGMYYYTGSGKNRRRHTEWFPFSGTAGCQVAGHLVSASAGLSEPESNALEPFDLGWAVDFDERLVSGFEAELPSIQYDQADHTATSELRELEAGRIRTQLLPGDENQVTWINSQVEIQDRECLLLPVWIGIYDYDGKKMRLLVNGQSGKCTGQVPKSKTKIAIAITLGVLLIAGIVAGFFFAGNM